MNRIISGWVIMATAFLVGPAHLSNADEARLSVRESEPYGAYVADAEGRALYVFSADTRGGAETTAKSACYGVCASGWPAVEVDLSTGKIGVSTGSSVDKSGSSSNVDESLIGTFQREDGSTQATYNGWPLYYHTVGMRDGEITSQAVEVFDGTWTLIAPHGTPIEVEEE